MIDSEGRNYYEILEVQTDASPQVIRAAYLRAKSAYRKDSVALYSLISPEETEELLRKIEEAFQVLSNPERRREYDHSHGELRSNDDFFSATPNSSALHPGGLANVVSIDRVPPMETSDSDLLVAPTTDFSVESASLSAEAPKSSPAPATQSSLVQTPTPAITENLYNVGTGARLSHPSDAFADQAIAQEIQNEQEWRGTFLRRVREARNVAIEELSEYTKISKTYLQAIEEEQYAKLPAPVYLRGFIVQVAKYLRIPHEKVAQAYISRYITARDESEKKSLRR